jgi:hypothetical protein
MIQGDYMASIELGGTLKALKGERIKIQGELSKLDKAITVLEDLNGASTAISNGNGHKRTLSVAARNKIARAQKLRWAKFKRERGTKG